MFCAQGVTNITMAELPTMPLTPDGPHSGRFADFHQICWQKWWWWGISASSFTITKSTSFEQIFLIRLAGK